MVKRFMTLISALLVLLFIACLAPPQTSSSPQKCKDLRDRLFNHEDMIRSMTANLKYQRVTACELEAPDRLTIDICLGSTMIYGDSEGWLQVKNFTEKKDGLLRHQSSIMEQWVERCCKDSIRAEERGWLGWWNDIPIFAEQTSVHGMLMRVLFRARAGYGRGSV